METNFLTSIKALFGNIEFLPFSIDALSGLLVLVILLGLSAIISGSEVALFSLEPEDIDSLKSNKKRSAKLVVNLLSDPEQLLASVLVGNNFVNKRMNKHRRVLSVEEISKALKLSHHQDLSYDKEILEGIVKFGSKSVSEIMHSRLDMVTDDVFEEFKGDADTLAGLILELTGEFPKLKEEVHCKNFHFRVEALGQRRIKEIRVHIDSKSEKK